MGNRASVAELVRRLQDRDPDAMADLYDLYCRLAYALILPIVRSKEIAEDLTQETFLRIWNGIHGFDPERGALGTWIGAVAKNCAIDYLRSANGRMARYAVALDRAKEVGCRLPMDGEIDRALVLSRAFAVLSTHQRLVLDLSYQDGMSQTEIANRLQRPLGTVKTWMRSALIAMRAQIHPGSSATSA